VITYKDAIEAARSYAAEIFQKEELRGLRVEEITSSDDKKRWFVTLGWVAPETRTVPATSYANSMSTVVEAPRVYKKFTIDAESGTITAMEMRY